MFEIELTYKTGDSFNTYTEQTTLNESWDNIEIASENLKRIRAHYQLYSNRNAYVSCMSKKAEQTIEKAKSEPWFVDCKRNDDCEPESWEDAIRLLKDDGTDYILKYPDWIGYFEQLERGEIITVGNGEILTSFYI